jgi:hypothetical protein
MHAIETILRGILRDPSRIELAPPLAARESRTGSSTGH